VGVFSAVSRATLLPSSKPILGVSIYCDADRLCCCLEYVHTLGFVVHRKEKETRFRACVSVTGCLARVSVDGKEGAGPKHCASLRDNSVGHPNASGDKNSIRHLL
jgi:hypothetical protein